MPIVADAAVAIRGDLSKFSQDLKGADKHVNTLGARIKSALSPANIAGGLAAGFAASKVLDFMTDAVRAASDMNETISKTGVILGREALPGLEKWAEAAADAFGLSKQQALDAASTFAIFGKSAGLAGEDLSGFSTELTELAADLGSFYNTSPEDAILAIGAALRGESEPIRRYGVLLDEATLRQRALKLGIIDTISQALTPQERVLAAQAEIFAQTADAQGDFGRTSEGLAGSQKQLAAELANVQVEVGEKLLPVWLTLTHAVKDLVPYLATVIELAGGLVDKITLLPRAVADAGKAIGDLLSGKYVTSTPEEVRDRLAGIYAGAGLDVGQEVGEDLGEGVAAGVAAGLEGGAPGVEAGAETGISRPLFSELKEAREKIEAETRAIPGDIARALIQGQADVESGMEELTTLMEESLSDAAKIAYLKGVLASDELARGLSDERADVRASAMQIRDEALAQLELLESGAADAAVDARTTFAEQIRLGTNAARESAGTVARAAAGALRAEAEFTRAGTADMAAYAAGLRAGGVPARTAAQQVLQLVRNQFAGSEPKDPRSPLRGITDAFGFWDVLLGGIEARRPNIDLGLSGLGVGAVAPLGGVAGGGSAAVVNNTWQLNVNGVPYEFRNRDDFMKALDDLSGFGDGRTV